MKRTSLTTIRWIIPLLAVMSMSVTATAQVVLYDTGFSVPVVFNGTSTNLGWTSGATATQSQRWAAQPFSLSGETLVTQINAEYFLPAGNILTDIGIKIWNRTGENAPTDADEVYSTTVAAPAVFGDDIWAELALGAGVTLGAGDYYVSVYGMDSGGSITSIGWFTGAQNGIQFVDANGPWMWRSVSYPAPGFAFYQLPLATLAANPGDDPNATYSAAFQIIGVSETVVSGQSLTVMPGVINSGGLADLTSSDNVSLVLFRDPTSTNAVTQFVLTATSPTTTPSTFEFTLEGRAVSRPNVVQRIEFFNYVTNAYETVDERNAVRMPPDLSVTVAPGGDLSRFVDQANGEMQTRIRYRADTPRAQFSSRTDQAIWTIQ